MAIERFEDLTGRQEAMTLAQGVDRRTRRRTFGEDRERVWPVRDAAASCRGNIAEAHGRFAFEDAGPCRRTWRG